LKLEDGDEGVSWADITIGLDLRDRVGEMKKA
jgi:hypothetical protein